MTGERAQRREEREKEGQRQKTMGCINKGRKREENKYASSV